MNDAMSKAMSKFSRSKFSAAHIVAIRDGRSGDVIAHQVRFDGGGPGKSAYFSAGRFGGEAQALQAAVGLARHVGVKVARRGRGGSVESADRGIRFQWINRLQGATLFVTAAWTDRKRQERTGVRCLRHTSYSTARHGLEGALVKAIAARTSQGAPRPNKALLLKELEREYRRGPR